MLKGSTLRIARPTDNLNELVKMYSQGLGFSILAQFENHEGFDGVILGCRKKTIISNLLTGAVIM